MQSSQAQNLERALAKTEADAEATLQAAEATIATLRKVRNAAKVGNLRDLRTSIDGAEKALAVLRQQFANAKDGWDFDEDRYFTDGRYSQELLATGQQMGVRIFERDERLYCYPALIRISSSEKAVFVDKKRQNRIRPSVLVTNLRELQRKPPRSTAQQTQFLEALFDTYSRVIKMRGKDLLGMAPVVPVLEIYELWTLMPGQAREYSKEEFARDIYLLDRSDVDTTRQGWKLSFSGGRGRSMSAITAEGEPRRYYGIYFTPPAGER